MREQTRVNDPHCDRRGRKKTFIREKVVILRRSLKYHFTFLEYIQGYFAVSSCFLNVPTLGEVKHFLFLNFLVIAQKMFLRDDI